MLMRCSRIHSVFSRNIFCISSANIGPKFCLTKIDVSTPSLLKNQIIFEHRKYFSVNSVLCSSDKEKNEKPGVIARFKQLGKDYWYVLFPVHVVTSVFWLGGFYLLAKSGVDLVAVLEACSVPSSYLEKLKGSEAGYYALTYACYKVASPIRYTVTVGGTTFTVSRLKDLGYLRTTKEMAEQINQKRDDMKEMMKEKTEDMKDMMKEKTGDMKEKMKEKTDDLKGKYEEKKDKFKEDWENGWEKFAKRKLK